MGGAIEGAAFWRRLTLLVFIFSFGHKESVFARIPRGITAPLQNGDLFPRLPSAARQPPDSFGVKRLYGFLEDGGGRVSPRQDSDSDLDNVKDFSFEIDSLEDPKEHNEFGVARKVKRLFTRRKGASLGREKADAYTGISALQVTNEPSEDGNATNGENNSSADSKTSEAKEEQSKESSQSSQEGESDVAKSSESKEAGSSANESNSTTSNTQPTTKDTSASEESNSQQDESKAASSGDSNGAESKEEPQEGSNNESAGESQGGTAKSSLDGNEGDGSSEKKNSAPADQGSKENNDQTDSASDSSEGEQEPQNDKENEKKSSESSSEIKEKESEQKAPSGDEAKGESASEASESEAKPETGNESGSEQSESASEGKESDKETQSASEGDNGKSESKPAKDENGESRKSDKETQSASKGDNGKGESETTKDSGGEPPQESGSSSNSLVLPTPAGQPVRETGKEPEKDSEEAAKETSNSQVPPQPSGERQSSTTEAEANENATAAPVESSSKEGATIPAEESRPEHVEGNTNGEAREFEWKRKCYFEVIQEASEEGEALMKKATSNVHFQKIDQAFCDEIFRRISGPYSLAELSALLRAADVADSATRNFRYCRATPTSSPPRVKNGDSVLHAAISARKPHVAEMLLQYGAFPELPSLPHTPTVLDKRIMLSEIANERPMHVAAAIQALDSMESMELLLQYGANANSRDTLGRTPLMVAAYNPKPHSHEFVKKLILSGADVNATDKARMNALHYAAASDNWQVIRILLDHKADPMAIDVRGNTPLHYAAAFNSHSATTKLLEKAGDAIDINKPNVNGKTPIHFAAAPESFRSVPMSIVPARALEALLLHHANPMSKDADGNNPLHLAARGGYVEIVRRLVSLTNIPAEEKNAAGQTPLAVAKQAAPNQSTSEIVQFLEVYAGKKSCIEPPLVRHSTRIFSDTVLGPYMRVGDTVTYTCNPGFTLYGHQTVICQERDGKMEFVPAAPVCLLRTDSSAAFHNVLYVGVMATITLSAVLAACP